MCTGELSAPKILFHTETQSWQTISPQLGFLRSTLKTWIWWPELSLLQPLFTKVFTVLVKKSTVSIYIYINPKPLNPIYTPNNKAYRVEDHLSWWLQSASPFLLHLLAQLTTASSSVEHDTATNCYRLCREDEEDDNNSHQPCSSSLMILYSTPPGGSYDHREDEMEDFAGLQAEWFYYIWTQQPWSP